MRIICQFSFLSLICLLVETWRDQNLVRTGYSCSPTSTPALLCSAAGPRVIAEFPWALVSEGLWPMRGIGRKRTAGWKKTGYHIDCFSPSRPARWLAMLSSSTVGQSSFRPPSFHDANLRGASDAMFSSGLGAAMAPCCLSLDAAIFFAGGLILNQRSKCSFFKFLELKPFCYLFLAGTWLKHY